MNFTDYLGVVAIISGWLFAPVLDDTQAPTQPLDADTQARIERLHQDFAQRQQQQQINELAAQYEQMSDEERMRGIVYEPSHP